MNRILRSSAFSLAGAYVALGIVALVLFAAPLYYAWQVTIQDSRIQILQDDIARMTEVFDRSGVDGLTAFIKERTDLQLARDRMVLLANPSLHVLAGNLQAFPKGIREDAKISTVTMNFDGRRAPSVFARSTLPGGYVLLVGRDLSFYAPVESHFWPGFAAATAVIIAAGALGGFLIRRAVLARVQSISETATAIMSGNLSTRLPAGGGKSEFDILLTTINRMLDQIENLFHGVRNVSNAIAHDLRTPLTELRSRLEELLVTRPAAEHTFTEIDGAVSDVDRVIAIFNALLRLAEIDSGLRRSGFVQVDASQIAAQAVEFYLPVAELKGVTLAFDHMAAVPVLGDPVLLAQALGNLIDNALKYAAGGAKVTVGVATRTEYVVGRAENKVEIVVADAGPGIQANERSKVVERFYRGDASRCTPGLGLGLSLVNAVAKLHGGMLELADNNPGLRATMVLAQGNPTPQPTAAIEEKIASPSGLYYVRPARAV